MNHVDIKVAIRSKILHTYRGIYMHAPNSKENGIVPTNFASCIDVLVTKWNNSLMLHLDHKFKILGYY